MNSKSLKLCFKTLSIASEINFSWLYEGKITLIFQDEASIQYAPTITRLWSKKGKQPKIPHPGGRKRQPLMGAVDPLRGQLYTALVKTVKTDQFQQFLGGLMARNPDKKIILYMDNAKAHHAKKLGPFLTANKDKLELEFLPKYSPDWNPQESIWKKLWKKVSHNTFFATFKDLQRGLVKFFVNYRLPPQEIVSLCKYGKLFNAL